MVYKFLQAFPLGIKSFLAQILFGLGLFAAISVFGLSRAGFFAGFAFANLYMLLFFYSALFLFKPKRRALGLAFLFVKWLFLLLALVFAARFLKSAGFLIGLSGALSFLFFYILESARKKARREFPGA